MPSYRSSYKFATFGVVLILNVWTLVDYHLILREETSVKDRASRWWLLLEKEELHIPPHSYQAAMELELPYWWISTSKARETTPITMQDHIKYHLHNM